ncbi:T9SS type A sorting domain-containing protein [Ferruginibacter albus]|uniref:T9SS type A sorting domain-containing protein n=1 Tax=Ferruginibacter albus TaxID=2875540 RepID=UPI001CC82274|nr:T9SS type A sorting domain-containing protein [Ferruginibacter albus]UAY51308.1 T9SS type A sorting domain-containing protein [Ferruginibacter albus]
MKKIYTFLLLISFSSAVKATIINISVTNYQFSPANVNVSVGDVVRFNFAPGTFHNATTNGVPNGLPSGAAALYSGDAGTQTTYSYTVTTAGTYEYVCEIHGDAATYSGMKGEFTASGVTPVILNKFLVNISSSKTALLTWSTQTEVNTDYFSVKKSTDDIHFTEIAKIPATGNSSALQQYNYTDNDISNNDKFVYYELAIVDKDGNQKLSNIEVFRNAAALPKLITQISPNPITKPGQLMVYFNSEKTGAMKVQVFDAEGRRVLSTNMSAMPGLNSGHIHVCDFSPGIYTINFSLDGLKESKRVVVN